MCPDAKTHYLDTVKSAVLSGQKVESRAEGYFRIRPHVSRGTEDQTSQRQYQADGGPGAGTYRGSACPLQIECRTTDAAMSGTVEVRSSAVYI